MHVVAGIAYVVLLVYFFILWVRFILDLVRIVSRTWRPRGVTLLLAESVLTLTDPPIKLVRRIIPPVRIGSGSLDFSFTIVLFIVIVLMYGALILSS